MSTTSESVHGAGRGHVSLDQLIALNDEMVALVRAGVPLERGLLGVGGEMSGRLGEATRALGERLSRGESLPRALAAEGPRFPGIYRAVVEAGLKSGRLSVALEGLARFARSYADLRRAIGLALLYPLAVLMLAYGLFVAFVLEVAPRFLAAFESFGMPATGALALLDRLGQTALYWVPVVPSVLLLIGLWWFRSGRAALLQPSRGRGLVRWLPWMKTVLVSTEAANFAELLALLVEHGVPFPEGVLLAAEASGDPAMLRAGEEIAAASRRGVSLRDSVAAPSAFPPLLRWMIATGQQQGTLVSALRHAAVTYRRRALNHAELVRVFLPTILMFVIGATATLLFALALFLPLTSLLENLAVL